MEGQEKEMSCDFNVPRCRKCGAKTMGRSYCSECGYEWG